MGQIRTAGERAFALRPLASVCLAFAFSVLLAVYALVGWQILLLFALCLFCALALALKKHPRGSAAFLAMTVGFLLVWFSHYEITDLERNWAGQVTELTVQVRSYPTETKFGQSLETVILTEGRLEGKGLLLYLSEEVTAKPGDLLTAEIRLKSSRDGEEEWALYHYSEGIMLTGSAEEWELRSCETPLTLLPQVWARTLTDRLNQLFSSETAAFLSALSIGDRSSFTDQLSRDLSLTGLSHMAAASGLHVHMLCSVVFILPGERRKKGLLLLPVLPLYAAMAGFTPSISRAVLMQELVLLAPALRREADCVTSLSLALAVILLKNPVAIANVGLQLSFAAMAGILILVPKLREQWGNWGFFNALRDSLALSLGANAFTLPLVLYYFGSSSLVGLLSNLLLVWLLPALLPLALLTGVTGWTLFVPGLEWVTGWVLRLIHALAQLPWTAFTPDHPQFLLWLMLCYLMGALALIKRWRTSRILSAFGAGILSLLLCFWSVGTYYNSAGLCLTVLDVGQGQCLLLTSGEETAVVDCGSLNEDCWNTLDLELRQAGREEIDLLILTHYDSDHISGVTELLKCRDVGALYLPVPAAQEQKSVQPILALAKGQGSEVCFLPESATLNLGENASLRLMVTYSEKECGLAVLAGAGGEYLLAMGDADLTGEERLLADYELPEVKVLVAGHHGSKYATGSALLRETGPKQVLISVGENSYGHPTQEMLDRCAGVGAEVLRTDENGTLFVRIG